MQNIISKIETEKKDSLQKFIEDINLLSDIKSLDHWEYSDLLPKGKNINMFSFEDAKAYLINRKQKAVYKQIEKDVKEVKNIFNAGDLISVKISIEWKRSRMWGSNPTAEAWAVFKDNNNNTNSIYVKSGSIGGCGYDKESTAVAECLNQIHEVLKPFFLIKDNALNTNKDIKNSEAIGYGAGYGIVPRIEGGVGVSCYNSLFNKIGFTFKSIASGKTFDVYTIEKIKNK